MRHAVATAAVTLAALGVLSTSRWALAFESSQCHRRVAIVGGGVAGASTAFYLNRAFEADPQCSVSIDVFEAGPVVGGRVAETVIAGRRVEVGGTIAVHDNRYMREWADASGTGRRSPSARTFGVWDGSQMSFAESGWGLWDKLRMLWRYGSDLMSLAAATKACVAGFNTAYDIQDSGKAFTHAEDMWSALGLRDLASMTLSEYVDREGICSSGSKVMAEIAGGVSRDNYCQNPSELNALAGLIGLAPLAAGGDAVWTTEQGNVKMVQHALDAAGAKVHKCRLVTNVHDAGGRAARERFTVRSVASGGAEVDESHGYTPPRDSHTEPCGGDGGDAREDAGYDAVVIAAPLHYASVELSGSTEGYRVSATDADRSEADVGTGQFHTVHTTIVHGRRNAESMGHDDASVPGEVLTMNAPGLPFWALGSQGPHPTESDAHAEIVKVFSAGELTDEDLVSTGLFKQVHESTRVVWRAYPRFAPPEPFESFEPAPGVFCATPLERGGSAMEIAAVGGRNAAMLVANRIGSDAIAAAIHVESRGATDAANDGGAEL